jgi:hypothetical protein
MIDDAPEYGEWERSEKQFWQMRGDVSVEW